MNTTPKGLKRASKPIGIHWVFTTSEKWKPSTFEIVPLTFSIKKSQLEIPIKFVKKELGTHQVKTVGPEGSRWLSVEGVLQDGFFYPNNLDLENLTLQSLF